MENLPATVPTWISFLAVNAVVIIGGIFALIGIADRRNKQRMTEAQALEDRVRNLYKEETEAQKQEIEELRGEIAVIRDRSIKIEAENKILKDLLQGRDKNTKEFQKRAEDTMDIVVKLSEVALSNGKKTDAVMETVRLTNQNVERLATAIEKHLENQGV